MFQKFFATMATAVESDHHHQRLSILLSLVIILSTITGFANVGLSEFVPEQTIVVAQAIIGGVNLLAGVLGTMQSFLKVAETMESHRS